MEIKFKSQICTSREQSERLLALGVKKETADMNYTRLSRGDSWTLFIGKPLGYEDIPTEYLLPAWSLHRLWELGSISHVRLHEEGEISKLYDIVIYNIGEQIKEGCFPKDYLVNQTEIEEHCKGVLEYLDYIRGEEE